MSCRQCLRFAKSLMLLLVGIAVTFAADEGKYEATNNVLDWLKQTPDFFLNPKLKHVHGNFLAEKAIGPSELLMVIPNSSVLIAEEPDYEDDELCELLHALWKEIVLGETSAYAPYMQYLQESQSNRTISPVLWSNIGKRLLNMISITLPRSHITTWIRGYEECLGLLVKTNPDSCDATDLEAEEEAVDEAVELTDEEKAHLKAFDIAIQHQINQRFLVPLYDRIQDHHMVFNVNHTIQQDNSVQVVALKEIAAGEYLQRRTLTCLSACDGFKDDTITGVLNNYGRVQKYPQFWKYSYGLSFTYDPSKQKPIEWIELPSQFWNLEEMENEYSRQLKIREREINKSRQSVPVAEWREIDAYSFALIQALQAAIADGYIMFDEEEGIGEGEEEEEEEIEGNDNEEEEVETEEATEDSTDDDDEHTCDNDCYDKGVPKNASGCEEAECYMGDIADFRCADYKYNSILNETEWTLMRSGYLGVVGPKKATIKLNYRSGMKVPFRVGHSPGRGRGVFTVDDIPKGTLVWTSEHTAAFETGLEFRRFLQMLPDHMVCDLLIWCYTAMDGQIHYIGCDLDEGSLFNTYDERAEYNIGGLKGIQVSYKANEKIYALRDITAGEELVTSYGSFDTDDFEAFGL